MYRKGGRKEHLRVIRYIPLPGDNLTSWGIQGMGLGEEHQVKVSVTN